MKLFYSPKLLPPTNALATNTHKEMCVNVNMELLCLAEKTFFYNETNSPCLTDTVH